MRNYFMTQQNTSYKYAPATSKVSLATLNLELLPC